MSIKKAVLLRWRDSILIRCNESFEKLAKGCKTLIIRSTDYRMDSISYKTGLY